MSLSDSFAEIIGAKPPAPADATMTGRPRQAIRDQRAKETTRLSRSKEAAFQAWAKTNNLTDVDHPESAYDYRGAYLANLVSQVSGVDGLPHWPDTFKQHGHPTFSVESKYSAGPGDGGTWGGSTGEDFTPPANDPRLSRLVTALTARKK